jgi:hypothetical protein
MSWFGEVTKVDKASRLVATNKIRSYEIREKSLDNDTFFCLGTVGGLCMLRIIDLA